MLAPGAATKLTRGREAARAGRGRTTTPATTLAAASTMASSAASLRTGTRPTLAAGFQNRKGRAPNPAPGVRIRPRRGFSHGGAVPNVSLKACSRAWGRPRVAQTPEGGPDERASAKVAAQAVRLRHHGGGPDAFRARFDARAGRPAGAGGRGQSGTARGAAQDQGERRGGAAGKARGRAAAAGHGRRTPARA